MYTGTEWTVGITGDLSLFLETGEHVGNEHTEAGVKRN